MSFTRGDIVALDFAPTLGHEQSGYRPALVLSGALFNTKTGCVVVCPITSKLKPFPTRVALDSRTKTQGCVLCEQIRTIDVNARNPRFLEKMPGDIVRQVLDIVQAIFD
jgi:mRNA interferase MazF